MNIYLAKAIELQRLIRINTKVNLLCSINARNLNNSYLLELKTVASKQIFTINSDFVQYFVENGA